MKLIIGQSRPPPPPPELIPEAPPPVTLEVTDVAAEAVTAPGTAAMVTAFDVDAAPEALKVQVSVPSSTTQVHPS